MLYLHSLAQRTQTISISPYTYIFSCHEENQPSQARVPTRFVLLKFFSSFFHFFCVSNSLTSHLYTANENPLNFGMKYNSLASVRCHSPYFFSCSFDLFSRRRRRRPRGIHFRREERLCSCDLFFSSLRENRKKTQTSCAYCKSMNVDGFFHMVQQAAPTDYILYTHISHKKNL